MNDRRRAAAWLIAATGFLVLYGQVLALLASDWATDDNYSHGFLILPFAAYFAWERRGRIREAPSNPSLLGLALVLCGLGLLLIGLLGAERFTSRISMLVVLVGGIAFVRGWRTVRILAFPIAFLLLMVPIPAILFNRVAFPLQLLASQAGEVMLSTIGIPVLREGNLIVLANTTLEVAEACSGIRSIVSLLALGLIYGYFIDSRTPIRAVVAGITIPIAILANAIRVAGTGATAHYLGEQTAQGFFHSFSGWLMFGVAFALIFIATEFMLRLLPPRFEGNSPAVAT